MSSLITNIFNPSIFNINLKQAGLLSVDSIFVFHQSTKNFNLTSYVIDASLPNSVTNTLVNGTFTNGDQFEFRGFNLTNRSNYTINSYKYSSGIREIVATGNYRYQDGNNVSGFNHVSISSQNYYGGESIYLEFLGNFYDEAESHFSSVKVSSSNSSSLIEGNFYYGYNDFLTSGTVHKITFTFEGQTVVFDNLELSITKLREQDYSFSDLSLLLLAGNDVIEGSANNDIIYAYNGNDVINGGVGIDTMYGGMGDDIYHVDNVFDLIVENDSLDYSVVSVNAFGKPVSIEERYLYSSNREYLAYLTLDYEENITSYDLIVRNLTTGQNIVNHLPYGQEIFDGSVVLSNDGRYIVYDKHFTNDIQLLDLSTGATSNIARNANNENANNVSWQPVVSADSRYVMFLSKADNLVENDTNDSTDVFLKNLSTGEIKRVSTDSNNQELKYTFSQAPIGSVLSADGKYVVFVAAIEPDYMNHVFIKNLETGHLNLVDIDVNGASYNSIYKAQLTISDDGNLVTYLSGSSLYQKNLETGTLKFIAGGLNDSTLYQYDLSDDGSFLTYVSDGRAFIKNLMTGEQIKLFDFYDNRLLPHYIKMSSDGKLIFFQETAENVPIETNTYESIFQFSNPFLEDLGYFGGNDTIYSSVDYTLPKNVESLILTGSNSINAIGTKYNNHMRGNEADNVINGGFGDDYLDGGLGEDIALFNILKSDIQYTRPTKKGGYVIVSPEGVDTVINIENIRFYDGDISIVDLNKDYQLKSTVFYMTNHSTQSIVPDIYSGPVAFLQFQLLGDDAANVVTGAETNDFINLLGGDDAAHGGQGDDVLDGGTGSNFLTGGAGNDTFFLDGRGGAITWSTITDFDGDEINIWGWNSGVSKLLLTQELAGAEGYTGVTLHYDLNNDNFIDTSITLSGLSFEDLPAITNQTVAGNGYLLIV